MEQDSFFYKYMVELLGSGQIKKTHSKSGLQIAELKPRNFDIRLA
jgi:hypothetical protein